MTRCAGNQDAAGACVRQQTKEYRAYLEAAAVARGAAADANGASEAPAARPVLARRSSRRRRRRGRGQDMGRAMAASARHGSGGRQRQPQAPAGARSGPQRTLCKAPRPRGRSGGRRSPPSGRRRAARVGGGGGAGGDGMFACRAVGAGHSTTGRVDAGARCATLFARHARRPSSPCTTVYLPPYCPHSAVTLRDALRCNRNRRDQPTGTAGAAETAACSGRARSIVQACRTRSVSRRLSCLARRSQTSASSTAAPSCGTSLCSPSPTASAPACRLPLAHSRSCLLRAKPCRSGPGPRRAFLSGTALCGSVGRPD